MRLKMTDECLEYDVTEVVEEGDVDIRVVQAAAKTVKASEMDVVLMLHDWEACDEHLVEVEPFDCYLNLEEVGQNDLP